MGNHRIYERYEYRRDKEVGRKLDTLCNGTAHDGGGRCRKHHLKEEKDDARYGEAVPDVGTDTRMATRSSVPTKAPSPEKARENPMMKNMRLPTKTVLRFFMIMLTVFFERVNPASIEANPDAS
jgi:hypothetical protein